MLMKLYNVANENNAIPYIIKINKDYIVFKGLKNSHYIYDLKRIEIHFKLSDKTYQAYFGKSGEWQVVEAHNVNNIKHIINYYKILDIYC